MKPFPENRIVNGEIVGDVIGRYEGGLKYRPMESIDFVDQLVNNKWRVKIPKFLAEYHDWWETWERERHESMAAKLRQGMTTYEVGALDGWQAVIFGQFVGPQNVVLIEPTSIAWPNIRRIWSENCTPGPRGCFLGFCSEEDDDTNVPAGWPDGPDYSTFLKGVLFSKLNESTVIPRKTIDTLAQIFGMPDAINLDVEGDEVRVLKGASKVLSQNHPMLWISAHSEADKMHICEFLDRFGYAVEELARDHEIHLHFY